MIEWTAERIAQKSTKEVKSLRDNAMRRGNQVIVSLCEADLERRKPVRAKPERTQSFEENRAGHYVSEFHFVCPKEQDVTRSPDGIIQTGTWVVAEANAKAAQKYRALVALHATRAEPSYLQGIVKGWEKRPRASKYADGRTVKTAFGIVFLIAPTNSPLPWTGDGTGEKGYAWAPIPK